MKRWRCITVFEANQWEDVKRCQTELHDKGFETKTYTKTLKVEPYYSVHREVHVFPFHVLCEKGHIPVVEEIIGIYPV